MWIKKETGNILKYKVGNNANIANVVCLWKTWLRLINTAWLYKEPEVSVLQANAQLSQKGECWTWNQRFMRGPGFIPTGINILSLEFFLINPLVPILALLPMLCDCEKPYYAQATKHTHPGFETQKRHHQKSKTGVSVTLKKDRCPAIFLKRNC